MIILTKFRDRPIISFIVFAIVAFILLGVISAVFGGFFYFLGPENGMSIGIIISSFVIASLYIYLYKIKGFFSFSKFKFAFLIACPFILFTLTTLIDPNFKIPTLETLLLAVIAGLAPGISEEIIFRGVLISYLMKFFKSSKGIYGILIVSALIFGLSHIANAGSAPLDATIFQVFYASAIGILFGAVYLRTGNLWAVIFFHALQDVVAAAFTSNGLVAAAFVWNACNIATIIISIVVIVLGFYYVRPDKHNEIVEVWEEKWAN